MAKRSVRGYAAAAVTAAAGILLGVVAGEAVLQAVKGPPPELRADGNFRWAYLDVYDDYFRLDDRGSRYVNERRRSNPTSFPAEKEPDERRVFIVGESVAHFYPEKQLEADLARALPEFRWNAVNCGMGGYDSYRVLLLVKEIVRYRPDLVVLMMGNNEGDNEFVRINHWKYRYPRLARSWLFRLTTDLLTPPVRSRTAPNVRFEENARAILRLCSEKGIPVAVCTLPLNHELPWSGGDYRSSSFFDPWWLVWRRPDRAAVLLDGYPVNRYPWLRAQAALRAGGGPAEAARFLAENGDPLQQERNDILRRLAAGEESAVLIDFSRFLDEVSGGAPGFAFFYDRVHYWPPVYRLLNRELLRAVCRPGTVLPAADRRDLDPAVDEDGLEALAAENAALARRKADGFPRSCGFLFADHLFAHFETVKELTKHYCSLRERPVSDVVAMLKSGEPVTADFSYRKKPLNVPLTASVIGEMLREEGRYREALDCFDLAVEAGGGSEPYCRLLRGLCLYDLGDRSRADGEFDRLRELDPGFAWLDVAYLDRLDADTAQEGGR